MEVIERPRAPTLWVRLALPYDLPLPDGPYVCRNAANSWTVHIKRVDLAPSAGRTHDMSFRMDGTLGDATGVDLPGAPTRYTHATIQLSFTLEGTSLPAEQERRLLSAAHECLNYFLDWYRLTTGDVEVRPLSLLEFYAIRSRQALSPRWWIPDGAGGGTDAGGADFGPFGAVLGAPQMVEPAAVDVVRRRLECGDPPRLWKLLLLNARSYVRTGETRQCVIDANTALDILVEEVAEQLLGRDGLASEAIEKTLKNKRTVLALEEIIAPRCREPLPLPEFREIRKLRNAAVHDGYSPSSEEADKTTDVLARVATIIDNL